MTSPLLPASESRRPVIITGLSGGGLSTAAKVFEDKGYFVSQNLPPQLILDLVEMSTADDSPVDHLAVVTDVRARMFNGSLMETIEAIEAKGLSPFILFLDARDEVLIRRFDSVRRTHPLQGNDTLKEGIERERKEIAPVRERADLIIDTTHLSVHDLRRSIEASVGDLSAPKQHVTVESFGFKHGTPYGFCQIRFGSPSFGSFEVSMHQSQTMFCRSLERRHSSITS